MSREPSDDLNPSARRLAAFLAHCQSVTERCERAVEEGNWPYLAEEAGTLSVAWDEVSAAASALTREAVATDPLKLAALVEQLGQPE
jgi:hypothetical protein